MRIKDGYVLRQVAQTWIVLPLGEAVINFSGMLTLNDSGVMLWNVLKQEGDMDALVQALVAEYDVTEEQAREDAKEFVDALFE